MAASDKVWVNGSLPDIDDVDLNGFNDENINLIVGSNQTATDADNEQTHQAVARYASYGNVLTAGGSANAIALTLVGNNIMPATLKGMEVRWQGVNNSTGEVTLNAPGIGILDLKDSVGGALASGDLVAGRFYSAILNTDEAPDEWWLATPVPADVTIQTFVAVGADTWTKPTGVTHIVIEAVGAGGGGGSAATNNTGGGGGGAGGFARQAVDVRGLTALTLLIGGGGSGGASGGVDAAGANGSVTTVTGTGVALTMNGGNGGAASASGPSGTASNGGTVTGGDVNIVGGDGFTNFNNLAHGGNGGASFFGGGGRGNIGDAAGLFGNAKGSGGGGGSSTTSAGNAQGGGDGEDAMVTITEYR